jgi:hypothetical protein
MHVRFVRAGRGSFPLLIPIVVLALVFLALMVLFLIPVIVLVQVGASLFGAPNLLALLGKRLQGDHLSSTVFKREKGTIPTRYSDAVIDAEVIDAEVVAPPAGTRAGSSDTGVCHSL